MSDHPYGLAALLENGARGVAKTLGFLAGVATWVVVALAAAALAGTLVAVLLYFIGRGVQHHATWAGILAIVIFTGLLVTAFGALSILPRSLAPVGLALRDMLLVARYILDLGVGLEIGQ